MVDEGYMVLVVKRDMKVSVFENSVDIPFTDYSDGCIGMIPVFDTFENAKKYSDGIYKISQIILGENVEDVK